MLLAAGADPNVASYQGALPLVTAVEADPVDLDVVKVSQLGAFPSTTGACRRLCPPALGLAAGRRVWRAGSPSSPVSTEPPASRPRQALLAAGALPDLPEPGSGTTAIAAAARDPKLRARLEAAVPYVDTEEAGMPPAAEAAAALE